MLTNDIMLMLLNIEALLGGTGSAQKDTVEGVDKKLNKINGRISDYLVSNDSKLVPISKLKLGDFKVIKERLNHDLDENMIAAALSTMPTEVSKEDATVALTELMPKLKSTIPINISQTLLGYDERPPSDYEVSKFVRTIRILENPLIILDLIDSNALTGTEVDALKLFYPSLYERITQGIIEGLADLAGNNIGNSTIPLTKNRTLSLFLGVPRVSPAQMAVFQKQGASEGDKAELKASGQMEQTDNQRILGT